MIKLAIDAMGGDNAPSEIVKGVNLAVKEFDDVEFTLFGDEEQIKKYLVPSNRVKIVHAPEALSMGEKDPIRTIRTNKELSLVKAFQAVHDK
ncbi:MAG: phosphate acyltransferase, partial [Bacilli bacterium]|nr:phosphate acyltransferase [Bacilli bacterium]